MERSFYTFDKRQRRRPQILKLKVCLMPGCRVTFAGRSSWCSLGCRRQAGKLTPHQRREFSQALLWAARLGKLLRFKSATDLQRHLLPAYACCVYPIQVPPSNLDGLRGCYLLNALIICREGKFDSTLKQISASANLTYDTAWRLCREYLRELRTHYLSICEKYKFQLNGRPASPADLVGASAPRSVPQFVESAPAQPPA